MIGGADCKFRAFDAAKRGEVQIGGRIWRDLSEDDGGTDRGDRDRSGIATTMLKRPMPPMSSWTSEQSERRSRTHYPGLSGCPPVWPPLTLATSSWGKVLAFARTTMEAYFLAGGCDGGTVSISLPENTGAEVGWPFGEPPACSTVTA